VRLSPRACNACTTVTLLPIASPTSYSDVYTLCRNASADVHDLAGPLVCDSLHIGQPALTLGEFYLSHLFVESPAPIMTYGFTALTINILTYLHTYLLTYLLTYV